MRPGRFIGIAVVLLAISGSAFASSITYTSADVPKQLADLTSVNSLLTVNDTFVITDVNVTLTIQHTFDSDLDIFLVSPLGVTIELSTDNGGAGDNYTNTIFDDEAAISITSGIAPFTGSFRSEQSLSNLDGLSSFGTWTLRVGDDALQDTGRLTAWSLTLDGAPVATPEPASLTLLGLGLCLAGVGARRSRQRMP